ncbi:MAG: hypothetical protein H0V66_11325 [Bdellovibrionales bacterium]|nr:hypothetical protein [Bdellovibrionales bacterium]
MKKNILFLVVVLFLFGCGKKDGSSSSPATSYGPINLEDLPELAEEYTPLGLSDKVIVINDIGHAPMDLISQELTLTFDPSAQTVKGKSVIKFKVKKTGRPYFELQAPLTTAQLDSATVSVTTIKDPEGQNQSYRSLSKELTPGAIHQVEFIYQLPSGRVSFANGGVKFLTDMTDLNGKFFEYWGPVGFEEDTFSLNLNLKVEDSTSTHKIFTNGTATATGSNTWQVVFPNYFSKSSFYVHLTNLTGLTIKKLVYKGLDKEIPIEVYGSTSTLVASAVSQLPKLFAELEGDYGAYPHEKFVAYMNDRSGGMEYVGATITALGSLDHELLHSWFARSVIPADGRSGWIDEAMASWRDYGYAKASTLLQRNQTNLANYSPFRKSTPSNSYVDGRALMSELDLKFSSIGGLKPVMKAFFETYKNRVVNNEEFWSYLEEKTNLNLKAFNDRYVMSEAEEDGQIPPEGDLSKHPDPLTREEILDLR